MQLLQKSCLDPFHPSPAVLLLFSLILGVLVWVGVHWAVFPDAGLASSQPAWIFRKGRNPSLSSPDYSEILSAALRYQHMTTLLIKTLHADIYRHSSPGILFLPFFCPSFSWWVGTFYTLLASLLPSSNGLWGVYKNVLPTSRDTSVGFPSILRKRPINLVS